MNTELSRYAAVGWHRRPAGCFTRLAENWGGRPMRRQNISCSTDASRRFPAGRRKEQAGGLCHPTPAQRPDLIVASSLWLNLFDAQRRRYNQWREEHGGGFKMLPANEVCERKSKVETGEVFGAYPLVNPLIALSRSRDTFESRFAKHVHQTAGPPAESLL